MKTLIVCTFCHRISKDNIHWTDGGSDKGAEEINHRYGVCAECSEQRYPKFYSNRKKRKQSS